MYVSTSFQMSVGLSMQRLGSFILQSLQITNFVLFRTSGPGARGHLPASHLEEASDTLSWGSRPTFFSSFPFSFHFPHRRNARGATPAPLGPLVPGAGAGGRPEGLVSALRVRVQTPGHEGSWGPGDSWNSEVARPRSPHLGLAARLPGLTFPGLE